MPTTEHAWDYKAIEIRCRWCGVDRMDVVDERASMDCDNPRPVERLLVEEEDRLRKSLASLREVLAYKEREIVHMRERILMVERNLDQIVQASAAPTASGS